MSNQDPFQKQALNRERQEILRQLENWLDIPMIVLSFVWLVLLIIELIGELTPLLEAIGITIWILFVLNFVVEFLVAPRKLPYLKHNWLTVFSLFLPALRIFRIIRVIRVLQTTRAIGGLRFLGVMTRTNQSMRALAASVRRRGFGYILGLTAIVILAGAAGMYAFEREIPNTEILDYGAALWWTAMLMTTMGTDYLPKSPEGRVLCFLLALYAFAMFGYVTATIATFFVGQDAEDPQAEVAGAKAIADLQAEIIALRAEIRALSHPQSQ